MKKTDANEEDELLPEYDLNNLRMRKFGPARKHFHRHGVVLEPDVAAQFPDSSAVNEALRFLLRTAKHRDADLVPNERTRLADAQAAILGRKKSSDKFRRPG